MLTFFTYKNKTTGEGVRACFLTNHEMVEEARQSVSESSRPKITLGKWIVVTLATQNISVFPDKEFKECYEFDATEDRDTTPLWEATTDEIFEELNRRFRTIVVGFENDDNADIRVRGSMMTAIGIGDAVMRLARKIQDDESDDIINDGDANNA